jgi:hypothetical protein
MEPPATFRAMSTQRVISTYRVFFGLLTLLAIGVQMTSLLDSPTFNPFNFFSYFTIQANLIAAAVLLDGATRSDSNRSLRFDRLRGGVVVYMIVVGVVFTLLLLSGTDVDTAIPWVNDVVHALMPIVMVADWLIDPPTVRLTYRQSIVWLGYPLAWIAYTLIKGPIAHWYPYPFLDPVIGGYGSVAVYCVGILFFMMVVNAIVVWMASALAGRSLTSEAQPAS